MSLSDICYCGDETYDLYRTEVRKARKLRSCEECGGPIKPGEQYQYASGMYDGYFYSHATCARCRDILTWLKNNIPCFCWSHGGAFEYVPELLREAQRIAPEEAAGLWFGYHRRIVLRNRYNQKAKAG